MEFSFSFLFVETMVEGEIYVEATMSRANWEFSFLSHVCPSPTMLERGVNQQYLMYRVQQFRSQIRHVNWIFLDPIHLWTQLKAISNTP